VAGGTVVIEPNNAAQGEGNGADWRLLRTNHILAAIVSEILEQRYLRETARASLSLPQLHLLKLLDCDGGPCVGEAASFLGVSAPAASKNVDKLARLDLLNRVTPDRDRRNTTLRITQRGEVLVHDYEARRLDALSPILEAFTPEESRTFARLLEKFLANMARLEGLSTRSCLRCGALHDDHCPVREATGFCPYDEGRHTR
jgi:DNA-binding MarR family transcriptional regulator